MPLVRHKIKRYGWLADTPEQRDRLYAATIAHLKKRPSKVHLRPKCPKVIYGQRDLGSCAGNPIACAIQFDRLKQKRISDFIPSRLFICYDERDMEGTIVSDSCAQIRDSIQCVAKLGDCPETEWPSNIARFAIKYSANCFRDATIYKAMLYQRVRQTLDQMKGCLASGYPFMFGFSVCGSFKSGDEIGNRDDARVEGKATRRPRGACGWL